jgi:TolA-binding protein
MKVVDLHPEELIDKLSEGELSALERERLDAHLAQCSSCRFEISVRADLQREARHFEPRAQLTFIGQPEQDDHIAAMQGAGNTRATGSLRVRSRRRWPLLLLAGSLVLCAGGAMAAVLTGAVTAPAWLQRTPTPNALSSTRSADAKLHSRGAKSSAAASVSAASVAAAPRASNAAVILDPSAPPALTLREVVSTAASRPALHRAAVRPPVESEPRGSAVTAVAALPAAGASTAQAPLAAAATSQVDSAASLFAEANRARREGNAERAVVLYRGLQARFPSTSESDLSRALLAQLLLDRGKPEEALAGFDHYLSQGTPVLSAEAWVGRARALEQLGKLEQARAAWRQVQDRFPGSVHARLAATRLAALGMR